MPTKLKLVIRRGDLVRIEDDRPVSRVGYPKIPQDFLPLVREKHEAALRAIFEPPDPLDPLVLRSAGPNRYVERALRDLAFLACAAAGFGGKKRELHFGEALNLKGRLARVRGVRTVKTGTHYGGCGGSWAGGEWWEGEPGALEHEKVWRLATVDTYGGPGDFEAPTVHLTKMAPCKRCVHRDEDSRKYPNPFAPGCCYYCAAPFEPVG